MLLTKVTPGIGLLWFAARREWRNLAIALGVTGVIVAVSFAYDPDLWFGWIRVLASGGTAVGARSIATTIPLAVRLPLAGVATILGARANQRWVLPIAVVLALPVV